MFRETRHQFPIFYPSFSIPLANEEFIEPPPIVGDAPVDANVNSPPGFLNNIVKSEPINTPNLSPVASFDRQNSIPPNQDFGTTTGGNSDTSNNIPPPVLRTTIPESTVNSVSTGDTSGQVDETVGSSQHVNNVIVTEDDRTEQSGSHQRQKQSSSPPGPVVIDTPNKGDEVEEPIPSYMEWAQKKQLELKSNQAAAGIIIILLKLLLQKLKSYLPTISYYRSKWPLRFPWRKWKSPKPRSKWTIWSS